MGLWFLTPFRRASRRRGTRQAGPVPGPRAEVTLSAGRRTPPRGLPGPAPGAPPRAAVPSPVPGSGRHRRGAARRSGAGPVPDPPDPPGRPDPAPEPFGSPVRTARAGGGAPRARTAPHGPGGTGAARAVAAPRAGSAGGGHGAVSGPGTGRGAALVRATGRAERARAAGPDALPWYEVAHARRAMAGRRDCGSLEAVLVREWPGDSAPPPETARAIDRLAELPERIKESLLAGVDSIHVGPGGVPELDDMARLREVPLPSGRATWDACAGAYGERKIIVGSRPSAAPDVMCHEVGHALDDIDGEPGRWQSDGDDFRSLYDRCLPHLASDFHRQEGILGRREFFADSFAAIASRQRPALLDMVRGDTRSALEVMVYFNLRYGI